MASPFDPRAVEVLAAALPPQGANPIGRATRGVLTVHAKRRTPGNYSQLIGTGPAFRTIFFPGAAESPYESQITPLTGLDDGFFSGLAIAMLCQQMSVSTTRLRPQMVVQRIADDLANRGAALRRSSHRFYAFMAGVADSPIRTALAAFPDAASKAEARKHYLAGITSPTWVNDKILQDASQDWQNRDWELFHHFTKLTALGAATAEIDAAVSTVISMGLPVPQSLGPGVWNTRAPWLDGDIGGGDATEATGAILATKCHVYPGSTYPSCMAEDNSFEFTANSQPGTIYRQVPSSSCFAPGTRIVMADATLRAIEDVSPGDEVHTPSGPRTVILRPAPRRGDRVLEQFEGTGFAFAASHPFVVDPGSDGGAAYAAADPGSLARSVPTLSQFGIRPLNGPSPAVLLRCSADGDVPFPAPETHRVPGHRHELLYDLYIDVGADGRSEYYAGDSEVQLLVSSEVPRFAAAPETTAVVLQVLEAAGPTVLMALADVPDDSFDDLLCVGLDSLAKSLMPAVGPHLHDVGAGADTGEESILPQSADLDLEFGIAAAVRGFAASLSVAPEGYDQRMGVLVEQFSARFAPQFEAVLTMPWRSFSLSAADVTNILAVTLYSVELFQPGPSPSEGVEAEVSLVRGSSRCTRRLPVRPGAPADRWYYSVEAPAYFPEWAQSGPAARVWTVDGVGPDRDEDLLWALEISLSPGGPGRLRLPLPRDVAHGYQAFQAPVLAPDGAVVGQAVFDVRLLTDEGYAAEVRARHAHAVDERKGAVALSPTADRLARLAAEFTVKRFADAVSVFRSCAATTRTPGREE